LKVKIKYAVIGQYIVNKEKKQCNNKTIKRHDKIFDKNNAF